MLGLGLSCGGVGLLGRIFLFSMKEFVLKDG